MCVIFCMFSASAVLVCGLRRYTSAIYLCLIAGCIGESAGGNLAAAVALKLRDDEFQPRVKMQLLMYPTLQALDFLLPSMLAHEDAAMLPRKTVALAVNLYLEGSADKV